MTVSDDILFSHHGGVATVTLNRPQALNAFTLGITGILLRCCGPGPTNPPFMPSLIRGAGGRAFCAGGDVRAIYEAGRGIAGDPALTAISFARNTS